MEITNCASSYVPADSVYQIFLKLPAKSLLRFRCVSKIWRDIIDGLSFAKKHIAFAAEQPQILPAAVPFPIGAQALHSLTYDGNSIKESDYPVLEFLNNESYDLSHIAYGLLLFENQNCRAEAFLYNPLRGEVLELPRASTPAAETYSTDYWYGMGFNNMTNTYKIVRVFPVKADDDHMSSSDGLLASEIYTMGTSSWRRISSIPPFSLSKHGVSVYGDMHWSTSWIDRIDDRMIISFDFGKEEFIQISPPDHLVLPNYCLKLTNLRESLAIIDLSSDHQFIEIWVMKDYNKKEWAKEYRTNKCEILGNSLFFSVGAWGPSLYLYPHNEMNDNCLYIHDLKMNRLMYKIGPWRDESYRHRTKIFSYTESILSLKNFGKLVSAAEGLRRFSFLKSARFIYVSP